MKVVIETDKVSKQFGGLTAVNEISMRVHEGEIVGLIGPNGAGKTTFLNALAGLDPPTSGSVKMFNQNTTGLAPDKMCRLGLARTFQIPRPFPKLSVLENVKVAAIFGNRNLNHQDPVELSRKMLEYVEFPADENVISESLNTVQLKRLDLARALASDPSMLFLDELAAGLTESELTDMMNLIKKIREGGISILMVEHIMHLIMGLCDRLVCIQFGTKIAEGPTLEVAQDPKVTKAYLGGE